jgi:AcrR family transcriptional regulator
MAVLAASDGWQSATVDTVCERATISKRTYRQLFSDREDVFVAATFTAPDLPISTFKLTLNTKTALTAARDLCQRGQKAGIAIVGASGARRTSTVTVPVQGCAAKKAKSRSKK